MPQSKSRVPERPYSGGPDEAWRGRLRGWRPIGVHATHGRGGGPELGTPRRLRHARGLRVPVILHSQARVRASFCAEHMPNTVVQESWAPRESADLPMKGSCKNGATVHATLHSSTKRCQYEQIKSVLQVCVRNAPGRKAAGEAPASTACAAEPLAARGTPGVAVEPAQAA